MVDYQEGKIYKLTNPNGNIVYIGSTCTGLRATLLKQKNRYRLWKEWTSKNYMTSFLVFEDCGKDNVKIELIEHYPCNNMNELNARVGEIMRTTECVNTRVYGKTEEERKVENRRKQKEKGKPEIII